MLERFFTSPDDLDRLRRGALSEVLDDVATLLHDESYSPGVARSYLLIAGHFSRWLDLEALRSLFRFAEVAGLCEGALAAAVPRVARWKRAQLPRALSDQQLAILLKAFDHSTIIGRRDYVITLCLAQLGLRAGEVAALTLDDIDWRSATLQAARGKERRASLLPLPAPLGRALADYLRKDRPPTQKRQLFVRNQAPLGVPLTSSAVTAVVRRAFARADLGVAFQGAHVLRHYVPSLTMSSDIGQRPRSRCRVRSDRGLGEHIARHSPFDCQLRGC
jgi:integrase